MPTPIAQQPQSGGQLNYRPSVEHRHLHHRVLRCQLLPQALGRRQRHSQGDHAKHLHLHSSDCAGVWGRVASGQGGMRIASLVGFLLMVTALVGLVFMHVLFSRSPIVVAVQVAAVALVVWARLALGRRSFHPAADVTAGDLVTTGPYRFIRHPIYTAACIFCWAGLLANIAVVPARVPLGAGVLLLIGAFTRMLAEERLLVERYPEYRIYAKR